MILNKYKKYCLIIFAVPTVTIYPKMISVATNAKQTIRCFVVEGTDPAEVNWYKYHSTMETQIEIDKKKYKTGSKPDYFLEITNFNENDIGEYFCKVGDTSSSNTSMLKLIGKLLDVICIFIFYLREIFLIFISLFQS